MEDYININEEVNSWFLMRGEMPIVTITAMYLLFVLKIGPQYMKNKQPYNLKALMLIYNFFQTFYNGFMVLTLFRVKGALYTVTMKSCNLPDPAVNPFYRIMNEMIWYFFISKVADLIDTVFLVLRKKFDHVTFLHIYHHTSMVLFTWFYLKYVKGEQLVIAGWLNAVVHTVMYSYYFLATIGPKMLKYLWWKKYLTRFQMVQFVVVCSYACSLLLFRCKIPPKLAYFVVFYAATFLALFTNFYIIAYGNRKRENCVKINKMH